uniref:Family with sequence similarity 183 member A n=1 Tax=Cynoglossus semilaevis TaxID=244447 RepID=A0A3P8WPF1_CYNSE
MTSSTSCLFAAHIYKYRSIYIEPYLYSSITYNLCLLVHILPDKPMSRKPPEVIEENCKLSLTFLCIHVYSYANACSSMFSHYAADFIEAFHKARQEPTMKYTMPMTESQEIGWVSAPLVSSNRSDRRLNFCRTSTDITRHKESALRSGS